jgi:transposase-like protein
MYSSKIKRKIQMMNNNGLSGRQIAKELGISKSGTNYYLGSLEVEGYSPKKKTQEKEIPKDGPKILLFDLESAGEIVMTFGRFKQTFGNSSVIKNGHNILCAAWTWHGSGKIDSVAATPEECVAGDDSRIVAKLWELYDQADAVVAHNSQGFDHKVLRGRAALNGFPDLPTVKVLDTLTQAKKAFRLPSNSLETIAKYFDLETKLATSGKDLWVRVQAGDEAAMQEEMLPYCEQDVVVLQQVFDKIRPFGNMGSNFNAGLYYNDTKKRCRSCGSTNVHNTGRNVYTALNAWSEYRCDDCGAVHRDRTAKTTQAERANLLT